MKKLLLIAVIGMISFAAAPAKAQISLSINIGSQPQWGPRGYNHVDYYYLPDVESYYYVPTRQFVYFSGGSWIHSLYLPSRYRGYDLYGGRKVVINSPNPWMRHDFYRTQYVRNNYYSRPSRVIVRNNYYGSNHGYGYRGSNNWGNNRGNWGRGSYNGVNYSNNGNYNRGNSGRNQGGGSYNGVNRNNNGSYNRGNNNGGRSGGQGQPANNQGQNGGGRGFSRGGRN